MKSKTGPSKRKAGHVLFLHSATAMGGAEYSLSELLSCLGCFPAALHVVISSQETLYRHVARLPVQRHEWRLPYLKKPDTLIACIRALKTVSLNALKVYRLARRERIQTVYCNTFRTLPYCLFVKWFTRIRIVCHCRDNIHSDRLGRFIRYMADDAVAVSEYIHRQLPRSTGTFRTHMIPNGVSLSRFTPGDTSTLLRRKHRLPEDVTLIGNIGRILPWKNLYDYLSIARRLLQDHPNLHFFIVGAVADEGYASRMRQQVRVWGLASCFTFTGQVDDTALYLSGFAVLLHTAHEEPFGRVLIEAAASAVPVIAYASGGPSEIVEHGRTGYLVPDGQIEQMVEFAAALLHCPALRKSMGQQARKRAVALFDGRNYARTIYKLLTHDECPV
jgi:glycosyltransferase involved in cell wall biosynthesis